MKSVLHTAIDKNGGETTTFYPTTRMILFSIFKAEGLSDEEACERAKLDPQLPARWKRKYGSYFSNWLDEAIDQACDDDAKVLERVGMIQATQGNYQFWRDLARSKGVIKEEVKQQSITINTDFTAILQMTGGDLNAARAQLLSKTRGLAISARPGMASTPVQQPEPAIHGSQANRTGQLQAGPLEIPNPLGTDRGRSEQGSPLPAVPQSNTSTSSYAVLDEGEISPGSEISPNDSDLAL